jgi:STE24 endopeptidase
MEDYYKEETYAKSQKYTRENIWFSLVNTTAGSFAVLAFIFGGGFNWVDSLARTLGSGPVTNGICFIAILILIFQLFSLPFSIYSTFVLEEKFGFNKTTIKTFILDFFKDMALTLLLGGAIFGFVLWFFQQAGDLAWVYAWVGLILIRTVFQFLAPVLILPLFNEFRPLEDEKLKEKIRNYAEKQNFYIQGIYVMDSSRRSAKLNAFFTGFGKFKRIVLFDTLLDKMPHEEILSIIAHEMGHYKKHHLLKQIVFSIFTSGLFFFLLTFFIKDPKLFAAFQMENLSLYASFVLFAVLYSPVHLMLTVTGQALSRKFEYQADAFSVRTMENPEAMAESLKKLSTENFSNLTPHPVHVFLNYSHPPVLKRIKRIHKVLNEEKR